MPETPPPRKAKPLQLQATARQHLRESLRVHLPMSGFSVFSKRHPFTNLSLLSLAKGEVLGPCAGLGVCTRRTNPCRHKKAGVDAKKLQASRPQLQPQGARMGGRGTSSSTQGSQIHKHSFLPQFRKLSRWPVRGSRRLWNIYTFYFSKQLASRADLAVSGPPQELPDRVPCASRPLATAS